MVLDGFGWCGLIEETIEGQKAHIFALDSLFSCEGILL